MGHSLTSYGLVVLQERSMKVIVYVSYTVGPVLIAWINYCVLSFASENTNLLITFADHQACEVRHKYTIAFPIIANTVETRNLQLI